MIALATIKKDPKKYLKLSQKGLEGVVGGKINFLDWSSLEGMTTATKTKNLREILEALVKHAKKEMTLDEILEELGEKDMGCNADKDGISLENEDGDEAFCCTFTGSNHTCAITEIGDMGFDKGELTKKLTRQKVVDVIALTIKEEVMPFNGLIHFTTVIKDDETELMNSVVNKLKTYGYKAKKYEYINPGTNNHLRTWILTK